MSLPPPALLPHLARHPGERFQGALLTAAVHTFPPDRLGASPRTAAVWACATDQRLWLCAWDEARERAWAVAVGHADQVTLDEGWRDTLHVGPWTAPLRRSDRKQARALIARWRKARPQGEPSPEALPLPPVPAPAARGAVTLPVGLARTVPSGRAERWLAAVETDGTWPVTAFEGSVDVPLWLAVSDQRVLLVALHPDGAPAWSRVLPPGPLPHDGRAWRIDEARLVPRASRDLVELLDALVAVAAPSDRWGLAARQALIVGSPGRAVQLVAEAHALGHAAHVWPHLGQVAMGLRQGPLAVAAAWRALTDDPDLDPVAVADLWTAEAPALHRTLRGSLRWREVRGIATGALDDLSDMPPAPELLPWPPATPDEVWATALALHGRYAEARSLWGRSGQGARGDLALAVLADAAEARDADWCWRRAAVALRAEGADAWRALAHATGLDETAADRWRWGTWAFEEGRTAEARASWRRALALDPEARGIRDEDLPPTALGVLAQVAEAAGYPAVAARALRSRVRRAPRDEGVRLELARVLAGPAAEPAHAADVLVDLADALDAGDLDEPTTPRWALWVQAARLRARAGRPQAARDALREALAGDFLVLDAWEAVLEVDTVHIPGPTRAWWQHVHRLLAGDGVDEGTPLPPLDSLDDATLDALHPGGAGWLDSLRRSLDTPTGPSHDALTRGLDRLAEARFVDAVDALDAASRRLALDRVPAGHVFRGRGAWGLSAWPSRPPALLIGVQHLREGDPRHLAPDELAFALTAELTHLRCDHPVLTFDQDWLATSRSVYSQVSGWAGAAETAFDLVTLLPGLDQVKKIQTVVKLARGVFVARGAVDKALKLSDPVGRWLGVAGDASLSGLSREGLSGAALQFRMQAERAGLLLTGDLRAAARTLLKTSSTSAEAVDRLEREGLIALLEDAEPGLTAEEIVRLTALVAFAATRLP